MIGTGREADVHAWSDDAVVKLYPPGFGGHRAEGVRLTLGLAAAHLAVARLP